MNRKGFVVWFTGLSGAGKTTIARRVHEKLSRRGVAVEELDGDVIREHLTKDLGFSREDRRMNIERVAYVSSLLSKHGVGVICSFISPYRKDREYVRNTVTNFIEVYVDTPLEICEERDVKGLYKKARNGAIQEFTGVSDPYEIPEAPDVVVRGDKVGEDIDALADTIVAYMEEEGYIDLYTNKDKNANTTEA